MGTIEEGIGYKKPFSKRLWEKLSRARILIFVLVVFLVLGYAFTRNPSEITARNLELSPPIELNTNLVTNPDASSLKLAVIEAQIINKQKEPVLSATITARYGSSSLSKQINLPAYFDEKGSKTSKAASAEFWLCSENRYKEALKVTFLRQQAQENCLIYDGNSQKVEISVSKDGEIFANKTIELK